MQLYSHSSERTGWANEWIKKTAIDTEPYALSLCISCSCERWCNTTEIKNCHPSTRQYCPSQRHLAACGSALGSSHWRISREIMECCLWVSTLCTCKGRRWNINKRFPSSHHLLSAKKFWQKACLLWFSSIRK